MAVSFSIESKSNGDGLGRETEVVKSEQKVRTWDRDPVKVVLTTNESQGSFQQLSNCS